MSLAHQNKKAETADEYNRLSEFIDGSPWYNDQNLLEIISNGVSVSSKAGLDIGCGAGTTLAYLAGKHRAVKWIGIDSAPEMAARARAKCTLFSNVSIQHREWLEVSYDKTMARQFDFILIKNVLHLIPDITKNLCSLQNLLTPTGRIIIVETISPNEQTRRFVEGLAAVLNKRFIKRHILNARRLVKLVRAAKLDIGRIQFHDQFIGLTDWVRAKATSHQIEEKAMSYIQKKMETEQLRSSMKYEPPTFTSAGRMLRRQIVLQCVSQVSQELTKREAAESTSERLFEFEC